MPVRVAPAPCRRAARRHAVRAPAAVAWPPLETQSQCLHSYASPLEARRRIGKRHMTGLMPAASIYPLIWQYDCPPTTKLSPWKAPTTPLHRRQKRERLSFSGIVKRALGWLELSPVDRPETPPIDLIHLRNAIHALEAVNEISLRPLFESCVASLHDKLQSGELSPETLDATVLDPLDSATRQRMPSEAVADELVAFFRSRLLSAFNVVKGQGDKPIESALWLGFAQRVCATAGKRHDVQLFEKLVHVMPASLRAQIPSQHIAGLARAAIWEYATHDDMLPSWSIQAHSFSRALQILTVVQQQNLDDDMRLFLLRQERDVREKQKLSISWLIVKAYNAHTTMADLRKAQVETAMPGSRLSSLHLWHLVTARSIATGAVQKKHGILLLEAEYESVGHRWVFLVLALMSSNNKDESLRELCSLLMDRGEFERLARALTEPKLPHSRLEAARAVAVACNDHHWALALHDSLFPERCPKQRRASWGWGMWADYAERIIKDPAMDCWRIWDLLHMTRGTKWNRAEPSCEVEAKFRLLDQMSQWFAEATHINDRQLQRELEKVIYFQRGLTGTVSDLPLAYLADLLTRDLSRGRNGRTERLEWLVQLTAQTRGMEQATRVASAIRGWRWTMARSRAGSKQMPLPGPRPVANLLLR